MADLARWLEDSGDRAGDDATLTQNMQGYVIPLFLDLLFIIGWIMTAMKTMGGTLSAGRGGGWCRLFCLILCFFQSFYGFCLVHSTAQANSILLMVFPLAGFIAFQGNNPAWLLGYARPAPLIFSFIRPHMSYLSSLLYFSTDV